MLLSLTVNRVGLALAIMIMVIYLPGLSFVCESYPRQPFVLYLPFLISGMDCG